MADKFTPLILDALARAATCPDGCALLATKTEPGLFPTTAAAKPAAKKALDDGLLTVVRISANGKTTAEIVTASPKGLAFLMEQASPKRVLEDFVRVVEERREEVRSLVKAAERMGSQLAGLAERLRVMHTGPANEHDPAERIVQKLRAWTGQQSVPRDCPLPDLFRSLVGESISIGRFHDALRQLHESQRIYLHPYTGPLYTLPEPAYALMIGHEVSYYANSRT